MSRSRRYYTGSNPARAVSVEDLRQAAMRQLPGFVFEYVDGGAGDERTLKNNRRALDRYCLRPQVLRGTEHKDLSVSLFGTNSALPIVIAPTGFNGLSWPNGDYLLAQSAAEAGIPMTQSTASTSSIAEVASVAGLRHWFQLYLWGGTEIQDALIERALSAGTEALVVTVDAPVGGDREWDRRNYVRPQELTLRGKLDALTHPGWIWRLMRAGGMPKLSVLEPLINRPGGSVFSQMAWIKHNGARLQTWKDIHRVRQLWPGKLILKGILRTEDVRRAVDAGADGIVLSNHGGRQCEPSPSPVHLLPEARRIVGNTFTLLVDSGFRRGSDIVIACALGADAVMLGRPFIYGLGAGGKAGSSRVIEILRSQLETMLSVMGASSIKALAADDIGWISTGTPVGQRSKIARASECEGRTDLSLSNGQE